MTELTDAMVEAGARALWNFQRTLPNARKAYPSWESQMPEFQEHMRNSARSILTAALAIQPEAERAKIIEECAKVAEAKDTDGFDNGYDIACSDIAAAIRALALPTPPPAEGGQKA